MYVAHKCRPRLVGAIIATSSSQTRCEFSAALSHIDYSAMFRTRRLRWRSGERASRSVSKVKGKGTREEEGKKTFGSSLRANEFHLQKKTAFLLLLMTRRMAIARLRRRSRSLSWMPSSQFTGTSYNVDLVYIAMFICCYKLHFKLVVVARYWLLALVATPLSIRFQNQSENNATGLGN